MDAPGQAAAGPTACMLRARCRDIFWVVLPMPRWRPPPRIATWHPCPRCPRGSCMLFQLFSRKPTPDPELPPPPYDPELLATLKGEHSILLTMLQQVREAAKLAHFQDLNAALLRFEM